MRAVRDDLQRVVRMEADASVLRRYLSDVRRVPDIGPDGVTWSLEADWPARIVLAWGEVERDMPGSARPGANEECRLFLLDHSRAGTACWCSMSGLWQPDEGAAPLQQDPPRLKTSLSTSQAWNPGCVAALLHRSEHTREARARKCFSHSDAGQPRR